MKLWTSHKESIKETTTRNSGQLVRYTFIQSRRIKTILFVKFSWNILPKYRKIFDCRCDYIIIVLLFLNEKKKNIKWTYLPHFWDLRVVPYLWNLNTRNSFTFSDNISLDAKCRLGFEAATCNCFYGAKPSTTHFITNEKKKSEDI